MVRMVIKSLTVIAFMSLDSGLQCSAGKLKSGGSSTKHDDEATWPEDVDMAQVLAHALKLEGEPSKLEPCSHKRMRLSEFNDHLKSQGIIPDNIAYTKRMEMLISMMKTSKEFLSKHTPEAKAIKDLKSKAKDAGIDLDIPALKQMLLDTRRDNV
ncbi:hypothetical protein ABG067_003479 [Albugo candida]